MFEFETLPDRDALSFEYWNLITKKAYKQTTKRKDSCLNETLDKEKRQLNRFEIASIKQCSEAENKVMCNEETVDLSRMFSFLIGCTILDEALLIVRNLFTLFLQSGTSDD